MTNPGFTGYFPTKNMRADQFRKSSLVMRIPLRGRRRVDGQTFDLIKKHLGHEKNVRAHELDRAEWTDALQVLQGVLSI